MKGRAWGLEWWWTHESQVFRASLCCDSLSGLMSPEVTIPGHVDADGKQVAVPLRAVVGSRNSICVSQ